MCQGTERRGTGHSSLGAQVGAVVGDEAQGLRLGLCPGGMQSQ